MMFFIILREVDSENVSPRLAEIVGVFVNTLTSDGKYPVQGRENFQLPFQTQLSEKRKPFAEVFVPFLDSTSNFKYFERDDDCHSSVISEITDSENLF